MQVKEEEEVAAPAVVAPMVEKETVMEPVTITTTLSGAPVASFAYVAQRPFSQNVIKAREQPKAPKVEAILHARYAAIPDVGDRAYQILVDLGMVGRD